MYSDFTNDKMQENLPFDTWDDVSVEGTIEHLRNCEGCDRPIVLSSNHMDRIKDLCQEHPEGHASTMMLCAKCLKPYRISSDVELVSPELDNTWAIVHAVDGSFIDLKAFLSEPQ